FEDGFVALDKESCAFNELSCLNVCHAKALTVYGQRRSVGDILRQVELDEMFYSRSNGGLTVTGGEPLMQEVFLLALLREAGRRHIHRAMETSSLAPEPVVLRAAALLDYAMLDVKSLNEAKHLEYTGVSNRLILSNIQAMRREFPDLPMHIRTPVIPGFNDTEEDIRAIAGFAAALAPERYELLPYHYMGRQKYRFIGREYPMPEGGLDEDLFERLKELALRICPGVGVVEKPRDEIFVPDLLN
ncbi:glycyl-radical enzyme activating protein, partial [Desulfovibrio sp. OttesenSCG-928-C14]|nr:glycyl-radical enzyme activating protein [Desulfovibrio sp. OttesenSCG-928-C14]